MPEISPIPVSARLKLAGPGRPGASLGNLRFALALVAGLAGIQPAAAELKVSVSRTTTGKWQSVGITVRDPRGGLDARPGPLTVTMADGRDRRQTIFLEPTGKAGVWSGRFTPVSAGRYTGTAVLERSHEQDLGLVPLVRVVASGARGFVRKHPSSKRALQYSGGGTLFPIPLRLHPEDLSRDLNWHSEIARIRAHDVNFLEVPVAWPEELEVREREKLLQTVDRILVEAEQNGRLAVLLRLLPPDDVSTTGARSYREQLERWGRRWAYSPALAAWFVAGATGRVGGEERASFVRALRGVDSYRHLVAVPASGEAGAGADLTVALQDWQQPANRYSLLEVEPRDGEPQPLPGEDSWQALVLGGIGLPVREYRPGTPAGQALLTRTGLLAKAAGKVPYQAAAMPVRGVLPPDAPGSYCRYGKAYAGWVAADGEHSFPLPKLPTGSYELLLWDPQNDRFFNQTVIRFDGAERRMRLPDTLPAAYLLLRPTSRAAGVSSQPPARPVASAVRPAVAVKRQSPVPVRKKAVPVRKKAAPVRRKAVPPRKKATPVRKKAAAKSKKAAVKPKKAVRSRKPVTQPSSTRRSRAVPPRAAKRVSPTRKKTTRTRRR